MKRVTLFLALALSINIHAQTPYKHVERKVLKASYDGVDIRKFKLIEDGEHLFIFDFSKLRKDARFVVDEYDSDLNFVENKIYSVDNRVMKKMERYSISDVLVSSDTLFILLSDVIVIMSPSTEAAVIDLSFDASDLICSDIGVLICQNNNTSNTRKNHPDKVFRIFGSGNIEPICDFELTHRYLLHYQNRNFYEAFKEGVLFLSPSSPYLSYCRPGEEETELMQLMEEHNWFTVSNAKRDQYNRLANTDPHALHTLAGGNLERNISYNVRIDKVDDAKFLITYFPGKYFAEADFDWRQLLIELTDDFEISAKKEFRHNSGQSHVRDTVNNTLRFNFHDYDRDTFCYLNGKRYQLVIEPHADHSDDKADRIKREQNISFIKNEYDLCIYSSKLE